MKNILLLSHVYPGAGVPNSYTPVVHYFAKEWQKMGYNVRVISLWNYFPFFFYWAPEWVRSWAVRKYGCALPEKQLSKRVDYELDGVKVTRLTMMKWKPASHISTQKLDRWVDEIKETLAKEGFVPDYIISHWASPQVYLSKRLKDIYHVPTALVLHEDGGRIKDIANWQELVDAIDVWGYRSDAIRTGFEGKFGKPRHSFRCYSGIPSYYLENTPKRDFAGCNNIIYVGYLLKRKYPDVVINAAADVYAGNDFHVDIVGQGEMMDSLKDIVAQKHIEKNVTLHGRLERASVIPLLDKADIFIMISKAEVFGLVYIEAMSRGCITIASKNEGMQGIIIDGENGFLCEAGNLEELEALLRKIKEMPKAELQRISENAISTASRFTDTAVAKDYIDNVVSQTEAQNITVNINSGGGNLNWSRNPYRVEAFGAERRVA